MRKEHLEEIVQEIAKSPLVGQVLGPQPKCPEEILREAGIYIIE